MKFKCKCGLDYYQIFLNRRVWSGTYVSNENFPNSDVTFDGEDVVEDEWTVQCEFCNKMWGPATRFGLLKKEMIKSGVLK